MSVRILCGNVFDMLRTLPDESVHCCVSSPPYWGLRSYLPNGHPDKHLEIGLEPTLGEHIEVMVAVFREVRRVLRKDGTLWLNYGDCYATSVNGRSAADTKSLGEDDRTFRDKPFSTVGPIYDPAGGSKGGGFRGTNCGRREDQDVPSKGRICAGGVLKPKDLCMVSNRLAIALQDDGWWLRSEVVWAKQNGMPDSSGRYRPSVSHEKVWMLTRSADCYYDFRAVMEPITDSSKARLGQGLADHAGSASANGGTRSHRPRKEVRFGGSKGGGDHGSSSRTKTGNEWDTDDDLRLMRNVWFIPTQPFKESHFATMPTAIAERCTKASCPEGGMVLDPFGGSGTTGLVADRLGRGAILIELNPEYAAMAEKRVKGDCPMFTEVSA